ncbi:hypothetical protein D3C81_1936100 [compost metagenome]
MLHEGLRLLGHIALHHRARRGQQGGGAFLRIDEFHGEAGVLQALHAPAAPYGQRDIAVLEQLGHLAG